MSHTIQEAVFASCLHLRQVALIPLAHDLTLVHECAYFSKRSRALVS